MARRIILIVLASAIFLGGIGLWHRQTLMRLHAVMTMFDPDRIVTNFSRAGEMFLSTPIPVNPPESALPQGPAMLLPADWQAWLDRRAVTGVVVLHDGQTVHEEYRLGTSAGDMRISWSLAKSYLSALFGILLEDGAIMSLNDPVTKYAPALQGGAYDKATILNVLQMSSGVVFVEDVQNFWSDINKMGRILALGGSMDGFAADLSETEALPGETWKYVSIDTHVLGMVLRGATGKPVATLVSEYLLRPMGAEGTPYYLTDGYGVAFVLGGLNLTTRDYARMGELFRNGGAWQGAQVVPESWVLESTTPSAKTKPGKLQYGYQWWMASDARPREYMARGIYGQFVYINEPAGVVIAVNAADLNFRDTGAMDDSIAMFRQISDIYGEGE